VTYVHVVNCAAGLCCGRQCAARVCHTLLPKARNCCPQVGSTAVPSCSGAVVLLLLWSHCQRVLPSRACSTWQLLWWPCPLGMLAAQLAFVYARSGRLAVQCRAGAGACAAAPQVRCALLCLCVCCALPERRRMHGMAAVVHMLTAVALLVVVLVVAGECMMHESRCFRDAVCCGTAAPAPVPGPCLRVAGRGELCAGPLALGAGAFCSSSCCRPCSASPVLPGCLLGTQGCCAEHSAAPC
jgi:hypothetical protein